jgi:hypothetical protein
MNPGAIIKQILSNSEQQLSSKRVITFLFALTLIAGFFICLLTKHTIEKYIFDDIVYIVIAGLGLTGSEEVTNIFKNSMTKPNQDNSQQ